MAKFLKWTGIIVILLFVVVLVVYLKGQAHISATYDVRSTITNVGSDSALIARGEHLANINGCTDCHGVDLSGSEMVDAPPFRVVASNLTSGQGGVAKNYDDAGWDRAIRHGIRSDGTALIIMPSEAYSNLSDADAEALIAFVKSVPPSNNEMEPTEFKFLGSILAGLGQLDLSQGVVINTTIAEAPAIDSTEVYGKYLANITCTHCHGQDFSGGPGPEPGVMYPGLKAAANWDFNQFSTLLRTGKRPDGTEVDGNQMPWRAFSHYSNTEMKAIYAYLQTFK